MAALTARLFPQAHALFEWLERHAQIRLSILLTYLFSKSPLLMGLVRLIRNVTSVITQLLSPFLAWLSSAALPPLHALATSLATCLAHLCSPLVSGVAWLATHAYALLAYLLGPLLHAVLSVGSALWAGCLGLVQLAQALVSGPLHVVQQLWQGLLGPLLLLRQMGFTLLAGLNGPLLLLRTCGQLLGTGGWVLCLHMYGGLQGLVGGLFAAWGMLSAQLQLLASFLVALAKAASPWTRVLGSARPVAESVQQASPGTTHAGGALRASRSLVWWAGQEAWTVAQLVRVTLYRCMKSMQAVINCLVAVCLAVNRHRVSLLLQLRR
ncbi:hypothetical protein DUNSADRAFT_4670 [Dunaliella salina]|uniref:Uncharacterized protein n=1 Tax=Dunaliella salina TaxID=3046 RepID=A0ABQ7GRK3_DUNSA|nr:hypothetical protein DUNSADRAFT_4670 [Dunaliella salina]|eukprot:KAF5837215.1 hypothetical protein DUNSADRAFT_4670 [Dunaliella salina]